MRRNDPVRSDRTSSVASNANVHGWSRRSRVYAALIVVCAIFGLVIGSFLNVVIYRVPRNESIVSPRSSCPHCGTEIRERDNVPVISWLLLRGRCHQCAAPISARYPLVELSCGVLWAGTAARFGLHWELPAYLAFS